MAVAVFTTAHNKTMAIPHISKQLVFCDVILVSLIISEDLQLPPSVKQMGVAYASKRLVTMQQPPRQSSQKAYLHNFTP
jgi:hypothetical protein